MMNLQMRALGKKWVLGMTKQIYVVHGNFGNTALETFQFAGDPIKSHSWNQSVDFVVGLINSDVDGSRCFKSIAKLAMFIYRFTKSPGTHAAQSAAIVCKSTERSASSSTASHRSSVLGLKFLHLEPLLQLNLFIHTRSCGPMLLER